MRWTNVVFAFLFALFVIGCASKSVEEQDSSSSSGDNNETIQQVTPVEESDVSNQHTSEPEASQEKGVTEFSSIFFAYDKYNISDEMKIKIKENAEFIKSQNMQSVTLKGNTDEFGSDEYNYALGLKRAISVRDALVLNGVQKSILNTISYGEGSPICTEKTSECYAQNRRTDLVREK